MELSILLAKIVGILYFSIGVGVVTGELNHKQLAKSFNDLGLSFIAGFMMVILGVLMVNFHNIWVKEWIVLITIIGWAVLIKGILFIAFPKTMAAVTNEYGVQNRNFGFLIVAIGLLFAYFGFIA